MVFNVLKYWLRHINMFPWALVGILAACQSNHGDWLCAWS